LRSITLTLPSPVEGEGNCHTERNIFFRIHIPDNEGTFPMTKLIDLLDQLKHRRTFGFMDDFDSYTSGQRWTSVISNSGGVSVADSPGGVATLVPSGGSPAANDETYIHTTSALFQFLADQPIVFEASVQFTEALANNANIIVGLMNSVGANALLDNDGGPSGSNYGMVFYKTGGTTVWACESILGGTNQNSVTATPSGLDTFQTLTGQWQPIGATQAQARFFIDGQLVADHLVTFSSPPVMQLFAGVKNGTTTMETLRLDYLAGYQLR
jgi:hypothetical protein